MDEKERREFESLRHRISGLEDQDGRLPTQRQITRSLECIFDTNSYVPQYAWEDPLLCFCNQVGMKNVERLTKIKIERHLHTCLRDATDRRPGGLGRVMQVYTPILKEICKNLRSLALHIGYDDECVNMTTAVSHGGSFESGLAEDDDVRGDERKSEEEKLDRIVGRVVRELKDLQYLKLGDYKKAVFPIYDIKWGKSARWMEIIRQRSEGVDIIEEYTGLDIAETKEEARERNKDNRRSEYQSSRGGRGGSFGGRGRGRGTRNRREGRRRN